jgi:hypothetical protein
MTSPPKKLGSGSYQVGYGRPPLHTRFRKGVSGNPGGRPRGTTKPRAMKLALQEAYRLIRVREGDEVRPLPAFQAAMRQLARQAVIGKSPAQRTFIELVRSIEQEAAMQTESPGDRRDNSSNVSDEDRVKALEVFLAKSSHRL